MVVGIIFGIVVGAFGIVVIKVVNMVVGIFGRKCCWSHCWYFG